MTKATPKFSLKPFLDSESGLWYSAYKMVDKWAIPEEERYFPCSVCHNPKYCFNNELGDNAKPNKPVVCIECYVPENPTRGWMLSKAKELSTFDFEHYKTLNTDTQQDSYLRSILKIKLKSDDSENNYNTDDR